MSKMPIKTMVHNLLKLTEKGEGATLLGIGPMSPRLLRASFEVAKDKDFPLLFIASRNQVDADELGGGYVNGWNQKTFMKAIRDTAAATHFDGLYYVCRDHGGPWQRDKERNDHLPEKEAMDLGKKSFLEDIKAGFDLLMLDPTKDPFVMGKVIPLNRALDLTIELYQYCEDQRKALGLPPIGYEVGTEETNGGLTTPETYTKFLNRLEEELTRRGLPMPTFMVGQTGTLVRYTEQAGTFNYQNASALAELANQYGIGLKEHNGDYMSDYQLLQHIPAKITATNVAPQFGTEETRAYLVLAEVERTLKEQGVIENASNTKAVLQNHAIDCQRWRKWLEGDQKNISIEQVKADTELTAKILDNAGHYTFNDEEVKAEINQMLTHLSSQSIDGDRFVVDRIKRSINNFVEAYNLEGVTSRIRNYKD
ncbi:class II D-tagatose-bisphosphate aldolase, non-catalytic subunit [Sporolactobacillus shoreicorticis]|uniref:Class II D-tagatose-bisphosphate aldolase non-catalytic subunit n=1 Tax=Sporolactobacillus shoreicorticis TaxID=1923877 RepID=A0ABW5S3N1_9BACL|nr:class II D-tagatose-bisphosphate aldolase, non-catalytic subunit [Sporolactobacillus shoreicorticis]MCO7124476.1 class II D-tagatose-bisphosphate aldolase, non-catalytic subunit [Sporolactobacillus shoreicorticis]